MLTTPRYRWTVSEFVRAHEAQAFERRVELVAGDIWPVSHGSWHGRTSPHVMTSLPRHDVVITCSSLPAPGSLLDPDGWVLRAGAEPVGEIGRDLHRWDPADVLLVVEVADEFLLADLELKARLYGQAGYPVTWVVTRDSVFEHTEPREHGYTNRRTYGRGERVPIAYAGTDIAVDDLLGPAAD